MGESGGKKIEGRSPGELPLPITARLLSFSNQTCPSMGHPIRELYVTVMARALRFL